MTGLDPARDALVEVAVLRVVGGVVVDRFATLLRSATPCSPGAQALHGIDPSEVEAAPEFADVAARLVELLAGAVPVMHGVDLDARFLDLAFVAAGSSHRLGPALDTVRLARRAVHARRYGLAAVCGLLAIPPVRWHRAAEDVRALFPLFAHLCATLAPVSALDLWQVRAADGPVTVRASIAEALTRAVASGAPLQLVVRTPGHPPRTLATRVQWFRPPHVGLAAATRALVPAILRADRVLRVEV